MPAIAAAKLSYTGRGDPCRQQPALPGVRVVVAEREPDEEANSLDLAASSSERRRTRPVARGRRQRLVGRALVGVLGDPDRDVGPAEPAIERGAEAIERGQGDARPARDPIGRQVSLDRIRVVAPGVELEPRTCPGEQSGEASRGVTVLDAAPARSVASVGRRLADCDESPRIDVLDARVRSPVQARVERGCQRPARRRRTGARGTSPCSARSRPRSDARTDSAPRAPAAKRRRSSGSDGA